MVQTHSRHSSPTKNHATQLRISALLSITVLAVFFANCNSFGQSVVTFNIPRVNDAPVINGEIDGDEWLDATRIDSNIEIDPRDSVEADVKSHALLMEDGEKLYVLFVAEDPDPENIRAFYRDRDNACGRTPTMARRLARGSQCRVGCREASDRGQLQPVKMARFSCSLNGNRWVLPAIGP